MGCRAMYATPLLCVVLALGMGTRGDGATGRHPLSLASPVPWWPGRSRGSGRRTDGSSAGFETIIELMPKNSFGAAAKLRAGGAEYEYFRLAALEERGMASVSRLPFSTKILLEKDRKSVV